MGEIVSLGVLWCVHRPQDPGIPGTITGSIQTWKTLVGISKSLETSSVKNKGEKESTPERFELSRGNPMYLAGTRLNHSAKASLLLRFSH